MRKGNLVPLSLPAGGHGDLEWRINPRLTTSQGRQPFRTHPPGSWHPGEEAGDLASSQSSLLTRLVALILRRLDAVLPGPVRPNPEPLLFAGVVNQPARREAPGAAGCPEFLVPTNSFAESNSCAANQQTP